MPRLYGYAPKGRRCFGTQDWGAKGRTNVIEALLFGDLLTVTLFQSNVNTEIFNIWIMQDLIPKLPPQSVVIMDNASFHKGISMQKEIEDAGHTLLYFPPYSPALNPIEKKWSQTKAIRRRVGGSIEALFKEYTLCIQLLFNWYINAFLFSVIKKRIGKGGVLAWSSYSLKSFSVHEQFESEKEPLASSNLFPHKSE